MTFTTLQQVYDALPGYKTRMMFVNPISGVSRFTVPQRRGPALGLLIPNSSPIALAATTPGTTYDKDTVGAIQLPSVPSGKKLRVVGARNNSDISTGQQIVYLVDRLVAVAFDGSLTTLQTLNTTALPARAPSNGVGVQMAIGSANSTVSGSGTPVITVNYTNDQGSASVATWNPATTWNLISGSTSQRGDPILLAGGDQGVQSVQSLQIVGPSATAGAGVELLLYQPILMIDGNWHYEQANGLGNNVADWMMTGLAEISADACLELAFTTGGAWFSTELDLVLD